MSVKPRGKSYLIDVKVGQERIRRTVRTTKQEAQRQEAEIRQHLLSERAPEHGLEEALLKYLSDYAPHLKDVRGQISKAAHLRPLIEGRTFGEIVAIVADIKRLPLKPATINRRLALLRRLCNLAYNEWGWLDKPIKISLLPEHNQRHIYLTPEQVEMLALQCKKGAGGAIRLAAYTGLRRAELFKLNKGNVSDGYIILDASTKSGRPRTIPIHEAIKHIPIPVETTDAILRKEFVRARQAIGMPYLHFHDLRHTFASWLAQAGVSLYTIGELLGHSQAQTARRYAHLGREDLKAIMAKLGAQDGAQNVSRET